MLKSNEVSAAPIKANRQFFAQKNRAKQSIKAQALHDQNKLSYQNRREQRRILARTLDPIGFLEANGLVAKNSGKHFNLYQPSDLRNEIARITYSSEARCWLSCGQRREPLGDTIALVRHLFGYGYLDAVDALLRHQGYATDTSPSLIAPAVLRAAAVVSYATEPAKLPVLPPQTDADAQAGRAYLISRGVDAGVLALAEQCQAVRYGQVFGKQAVFFVGFDDLDDCKPMSITHRSITGSFKGDIENSDKAFPCILIGETAYDIEIVEGGVSGLATQTRAKREGRPTPTVIVTGGASIMRFLENNLVRELLGAPDLERVTVWFENETLSPKAIKRDAADTNEATVLALLDAKQARSDADHEKQIAGIEAISQVKAARARPADLRHKDVADVLITEITAGAAGSIADLVVNVAAQNRDSGPERA